MAESHKITIDGTTFQAQAGELLLDAALENGVDLPFNCRAGHCGTCCVRLVAGNVHGGEGSEPHIVHACQCRIAGDAILEKRQASVVRSVDGTLSSLRRLSPDVVEVGISTDAALPNYAGQYAQVQFNGFPSRPFSITHPVSSSSNSRSVWFHIRRMPAGRVTTSLGGRIKVGHRVKLTGPFGSAYFRPSLDGRLILVATNTGFAPIWSIAVAALRENPRRRMLVVAGGRSLTSLYMGPALARLASFPNVRVVPICSSLQTANGVVLPGRPTDYMPLMLPTDVVYACGAPAMVNSIKAVSAHFGAVCYSDPFLPTTEDAPEEGVLTRAMQWLTIPSSKQPHAVGRKRRENHRLKDHRHHAGQGHGLGGAHFDG